MKRWFLVLGVLAFACHGDGNAEPKKATAPKTTLPMQMTVAEATSIDTAIYELRRDRNMVVDAAVRKATQEWEDRDDVKKKFAALKRLQQKYQFELTDDPDLHPLRGNPVDTVDMTTGAINRKGFAKQRHVIK